MATFWDAFMWMMGGYGGNQAQPQQPPVVPGQQIVPAAGQFVNPAAPVANVVFRIS